MSVVGPHMTPIGLAQKQWDEMVAEVVARDKGELATVADAVGITGRQWRENNRKKKE